jgi:parallel beta-helix repeat protein
VKNKFGSATVFGLALAFTIFAAVSANAAGTVFVGGCGTPSFATIQDGVNHATAGSTVDVCPGTYPEQVSINKRLTLQGIAVGTANQAIVAAPAGGVVANTVSLTTGELIAAQIWVHDTTAVTISNLTVDGAGNGISSCSPDLVGVYYQDASGVVNHIVTRNQTAGLTSPLNGCQWGLGIFVQSGVSTVTGKSGTSTVTVLNSSVHDFQKNGITGNEVGTTINAVLNQVRGQGPTTGAAENGIQIADGAEGEVANNSVIDLIYSPCVSISDCAATANGILVDDSQGINITSNHVGNTQGGVAIVGDGASSADDQTISGNVLDGTLVFDGIDVCGSNGGTINNNTVAGSGQSAIHLDSTCTAIGGPAGGGASVSNNTVNEACAGILNGTSGNTISASNSFFNTTNTTLVGDSCTVSQADIARLADGAEHASIRPSPTRP